MKHNYFLKNLLLLSIGGFACISSLAQETSQKREGSMFKRKETPTLLRPFSSTVYDANIGQVSTVRGDVLRDANKDTIIDFQVSPLGINFVTVEKGSKGKRKAQMFSFDKLNDKLVEFSNKNYGTPINAIYTPEGKTLIVATDNKLYITDNKLLIPQQEFAEYSFTPELMAVSPNGYFLVLTNGDKAAVYNLEERKIRTIVDAGEKINDIAFSPDNSDMAVLTDDGVLSIYSTRTFDLRKMVDDLGKGIAFSYNLDGKYAAVVESPEEIVVVNLLQDSDREHYPFTIGGVSDVAMVPDANMNTVMAYPVTNGLVLKRLPYLKPYYGRLIDDEVDHMMDEWLKMLPGETMEQYRQRVTSEGREKQRAMFEFEVSTRLAGNILSETRMTLGSYDRANGVLEVLFDKMPSIYIPVPEDDITAFTNTSNLKLNDVLFGITPDDNFEIVYAEIYNSANDKNYIFDNRARAKMNYMKNDDVISLDILQQQQMAEIKLKELREQVMRESKQQNIISDHTNITVDSRLSPEYDANGNQILNYIVTFSYDVSPGFSAQEDYKGGRYHIEESGAGSSMLKIAKEALEGELKPYFDKSKKVNVKITGSADASPVVKKIIYDGVYDDYEDEPVYVNGQLTPLTVKKNKPIANNQELGFVRALGVKDYLERNIQNFKEKNKDYKYEVNVSKEKGSEYRRVVAEITFVDAF